MMSVKNVGLNTQTHTYDKTLKNKYEGTSPEKTTSTNPSSPPLSNGPLTIEKHILDEILRPPKSMIKN